MQSFSSGLIYSFLLLTVAGASGCGGTSFEGDQSRKAQPGEVKEGARINETNDDALEAENSADADTPDGSQSSDEGETEDLDLAVITQKPNGQAIASCLKEWGDHPFTMKDVEAHRQVDVVANMLGRTQIDDSASGKIEIVVVKVATATLGSADVTLRSPNAWYCLDLGAQSLGATSIAIHCKAHIGNQKTSTGGLGSAKLSRSCDL